MKIKSVLFYDDKGRLRRNAAREWVAELKSKIEFETSDTSVGRMSMLLTALINTISKNAVSSLHLDEDSKFLNKNALPPVPFDLSLAVETVALSLASDFLTIDDIDVLTHRLLRSPSDVHAEVRTNRSRHQLAAG